MACQVSEVSSSWEVHFRDKAQACWSILECYEILEMVDCQVVGGLGAQSRVFLEWLGGAIGSAIDFLCLGHAFWLLASALANQGCGFLSAASNSVEYKLWLV